MSAPYRRPSRGVKHLRARDRETFLTARLLLVTHAATESTRSARFPVDEPVESMPDVAWTPRPDAVIVRGPESRCAQTCSAAGLLGARADDAVRDWDLGAWSGRTLDEVGAAEPEAVRLWLTEPAATPHGGESLARLVERAGGWLRGLGDGVTVAVTSPAFVRAALVAAIGSGHATFWRFDVAPLTVTELAGGDGRWSVRLLGADPASVPALHRG